MKIQCVMCKEIVPIGAFEPKTNGVEITCAACAQTFFLPRSGDRGGVVAVADGEKPKAPRGDGDDAECPKCSAMVSGELSACKSCGLLRERFESFAAGAAAEADPVLESLWETVAADWSNPEAHEKFVARASATGDYAPAARHYREVLRDRPGEPIATARLARITKMAEVALLSARPSQVEDEGPNPYRGLIVLLGFLLVIAVIAGFWAITKAKDTPSKRKPAVTQPASGSASGGAPPARSRTR